MDTMNSTPGASGGTGAYTERLIAAYRKIGAGAGLVFGFVDNWMGERHWCENFGPHRYFYDLPYAAEPVVYHAVQAFRCAFRNAHHDIERFRDRKIIVTHHDFIDLDFPTLFDEAEIRHRRGAYRSMPRYDGIITPSNEVADRLMRDFAIPAAKIAVIPHGNDQYHGHGPAGPPAQQAPYILFIGKLYEHKNWKRLLQAVGIARQDFASHGARLAFVSADYEAKRAELEQMRDNLQLRDIVEFHGYLPDRKLGDMFRAANGFVFPSVAEGFGMPLLEAMAFGLPLCIADTPVFREIVGRAAYPATLFDPLSAASIAAGLRQFLPVVASLERHAPYQRRWQDVAQEHLSFFDTIRVH
jgi:glycosyltransferase involved in cell wall biosynthesis